MIAVSDKYKESLASGNRNFQVNSTLTLTDGTQLAITNACLWSGGFTIEDAVTDESSFQVGGAIINQCTIILNNIYDDYTKYDFYGATLDARVGLQFDDGTTEYMRKGMYVVADTDFNGSLITLTCYDYMYLLDRTYDLDLNFPTTAFTLVQQICLKSGVTLNSTSFPHSDYSLQEPLTTDSLTYRTALMWVCQICGCFARFNNYGELEIGWFNQTALENPTEYESAIHKISSAYSKELSTDDVVITGVQITETLPDDADEEEAKTYLVGTDDYTVSIESNEFLYGEISEEIATWLGNQLVGFQFRNGQITHLSDPTIEAGDVAIFTDEKSNEYKLIVSGTTFTLNSSQTTRSSAETPVRNSSQRYSSATSNYVKARSLVIKEKTQRESAIESLSKRIDGAGGFYTTIETDSAGGKIFYLHNKPTLTESTMAWKMTSEAFAVSTTKDSSGDFVWSAGMTVDGDVIARILTATGINASWINTGSMNIVDSDGNTIFSLDVDKKTANISGSTVEVRGMNVEQALQEVEDNAKVLQANIESSLGTVLGSTENTTLICNLWENNVLIDTLGNDYKYVWSRKADGTDDSWSATGKKISVATTDFRENATYTCSIQSGSQLTDTSTTYKVVVVTDISLYRNVEETVKEYHYTKEETEQYVKSTLEETDLEKINGSIQNMSKKLNETYDTAEEHTQTLSEYKQTLNGNNLLRNSETLIFDSYIIGNILTDASGNILTDADGDYLIL